MTPAQKRSLLLLAQPGAEAHVQQRSIRWRVVADGAEIGTIHAVTLWKLRLADWVETFNGGGGASGGNLDFRQRVTPAGREKARTLR